MEDTGEYAETLGFEDESYLDLFHAVMRLNKKYRVPFMPIYYEGYSTAEISSFLDVPENDVHQSGGGVSINADGTERPLTEEKLWDEIKRSEEFD